MFISKKAVVLSAASLVCIAGVALFLILNSEFIALK